MDKKQKELIKTYYRKRNIASETNDLYEFENYEVNDFIIKNKLIPYDKINTTDISKFIANNPDLINYFKNRLGKLSPNGISLILFKQPQLIDYFKDRLSELSSYNVSVILSNQPQLIDYFKNRLDKLSPNDIILILSDKPELGEYFKDRLNNKDKEHGYEEFRYFEIKELLEAKPELAKYFDKNKFFKELDDDFIFELLYKHPQVIGYFKDRLGELDKNYIPSLLNKHPQLKKYFNNG